MVLYLRKPCLSALTIDFCRYVFVQVGEMASMMAGVKHIASLGVANMEGPYGVAMVKATNLDIVAPKEKHVRFLIQWTNENTSDDDLASVFKCLQTRLEEKVSEDP